MITGCRYIQRTHLCYLSNAVWKPTTNTFTGLRVLEGQSSRWQNQGKSTGGWSSIWELTSWSTSRRQRAYYGKTGAFETLKPTPNDTPFPKKLHLLAFPNSSTNGDLIVQQMNLWEPLSNQHVTSNSNICRKKRGRGMEERRGRGGEKEDEEEEREERRGAEGKKMKGEANRFTLLTIILQLENSISALWIWWWKCPEL